MQVAVWDRHGVYQGVDLNTDALDADSRYALDLEQGGTPLARIGQLMGRTYVETRTLLHRAHHTLGRQVPEYHVAIWT